MDDVDMGQSFEEAQLAEQIKKARTDKPVYDWYGACWCGHFEWITAPRYFCGTYCRDLYEKEMRMRKINGG